MFEENEGRRNMADKLFENNTGNDDRRDCLRI